MEPALVNVIISLILLAINIGWLAYLIWGA